MKEIPSDYSVEVDSFRSNEWTDILQRFDDASLYQTWAYGSVRWGENNLSHLALRKNGAVIAATQLRIVKIPLIDNGIAYTRRGPLWRCRGTHRDVGIFRRVIRALCQEYIHKRGLYLRILPNEYDEQGDDIHRILEEEGFQKKHSFSNNKTILKDLTYSLKDLRKSLHKSWRRNLRRAEENNLRVRDGNDDYVYKTFMNLYEEMYARKNFVKYVDIEEFRQIQKNLPDDQKMHVLICENQGEPVAGLVWSIIGDTGITILSATSNKGLDVYGSYLLRWRLVEQLKEINAKFLDQGGINQKKNPGGYIFKSGMGGSEVCLIGHYDAWANLGSLILVRLGDLLRSNCRRLREIINHKRLFSYVKANGS